jgi:threonine aldolase
VAHWLQKSNWQTTIHYKGWLFYNFIGTEGVRLMCSWATTTAGIDQLVQDIAAAVAATRSENAHLK